jgi:6,7-dimethyl-8-ribityllumazine synthase
MGGAERVVEAKLDASGIRFAIVASRFNGALVERLVGGALDCLRRHGAAEEAITVLRVPGSFELPQGVQKLLAGGGHDAIIALGVLIRGETPHFDLIASTVTRALSDAAVASGSPVAFGVVTAESTEQAAERSGGKMGNRGWDAACAAIEMARLGRELG